MGGGRMAGFGGVGGVGKVGGVGGVWVLGEGCEDLGEGRRQTSKWGQMKRSNLAHSRTCLHGLSFPAICVGVCDPARMAIFVRSPYDLCDP